LDRTRGFGALRVLRGLPHGYRSAFVLPQKEIVVADLVRCLCIVSRDSLHGRDFLAAVQASVRPEDHLEIVVDRRRGEPSSHWQGAEDRRKRPHVDLALQKHGVAIVPAAVPGDERRPEPFFRDQTSGRDQASGELFDGRLFGHEILSREIPERETPLNERSVKAERGPQPLGFQSRLASRVTPAPEDFQGEPYEDHDDDDDAERLESILNYKRDRSRRLLLPWILAGMAIIAAAVIILFPLAHSLKQSGAPRAVSEVAPPPRATEPPAGGEPSSLSSRGDTSAVPPRDNREPAAESSAPAAPQARRARPSDDASAASPRDNREPAAESSTPAAPQARRARSNVTEPAPRQAASAPPTSEPTTRFTSPRFAGVPSVDVSREPGSSTEAYSARIVDPAGRPLADADVLLLARMSDGTVENVRMQFLPDRGTYRGALPPTRSSLVDLRVRVITGDKRIEIPVGP
jgi:hypothetical protein